MHPLTLVLFHMAQLQMQVEDAQCISKNALVAIRSAGSPTCKLATLVVIKACCGVKIIRLTSPEKFRRDSAHDDTILRR